MIRRRLLSHSTFVLPILAGCLLFSGCSDSPEKLLERAGEQMQNQDWFGAFFYLQDFLDQFPDNDLAMQAMQMKATCHANLGEFEEARAVYKEIAEKYPQEEIKIGSKMRIAEMYFYEQKYDESRQAYGEVIANASTPVELELRCYNQIAASHIAEASFALARDDFDNAIATLVENASEISNSINEVHEIRDTFRLYKARTWLNEGDRKSAAKAYQEMADDETSSDVARALALFLAADSLDRADRGEDRNAVLSAEAHDAVVNAYNELIEKYPENDYSIWARVELARIYRDDGDQEKADTFYNKAIESYTAIINNPIDEDQLRWALSKIGDANLRMERLEEAKKTFTQLYSQSQDSPDYANLARMRVEDIERQIKERDGGGEGAGESVEGATTTIQESGSSS